MLGVCNQNIKFIFVLPSWEGSASDPRVLQDAMSRPNGLRIPIGKTYKCINLYKLIRDTFGLLGRYYLVDAGYTNEEGFLAPYRGTRYHLSEWRDGCAPINYAEYFNMKHAFVRNVIERCFGVIKMR